MKKLILILGLVLMLTFLITLTALATPKIPTSGYFYQAQAPYTFCFVSYDEVIDGCGYYITENNGQGQTAIWDGMVEGKYGTCVIHVRADFGIDSHVSVNQCTGDLAGLQIVADGEFSSLPFTWEGWYHWAFQDE